MSKDDRRMHGGDTPGLAGRRGHERHEEPVRLDGRPEPGSSRPVLDGPAEDLLKGRVEPDEASADGAPAGGGVAGRQGARITGEQSG
jgi:hypothetical protein